MAASMSAARQQFTDFVKPVDRQEMLRKTITGLGVLGGVFALISMFVAMWPEANKEATNPGNTSVPAASLVTGFARDYVTTYLGAKAGEEQKLARFVTVKNLKLPPMAAEFTDSDIAFAKQVSTTGDGVAVWTVTVSGIVNGDTAVAPQRTFYRVPISVIGDSPRAGGLPSQVAAPSVGVDLKFGYRNTVDLNSAMGQTASGFVTSYLTGGTDFARYVTADSVERPIDPAPYMKVDVVKIEANVPKDGTAATAAEAYVTVAARTKNYTLTMLAYPLSMRTVEGRWQITAIPAVPLPQSSISNPLDAVMTTATTTTSPPPPTRG